MDITSILITIIGIIFIIGLYLISRITQSKLPKNKLTPLLPDIKDENGEVFSSVLDDIPATDQPTPSSIKTTKNSIDDTLVKAENASVSNPSIIDNNTQQSQTESINKQQIVLFISAEDEEGLDGNLIKRALHNNGLSFGDKDIYHYLVKSNSNNNLNSSLFRIANGVAPWTLTEQDLTNKKLAGLSIVMFLPTIINDKKAIEILIDIAETLTHEIKGVLKNQQQQIFTPKDKALLMS